MTFEAQLASVRTGQADLESLADLARTALAEGEEECALPLLSRAASQNSDARLWQWTGLLQRGLDEHEAALVSFARAAQIAPSDFSIAHGRAHVTLEAGLDAVAMFEQARRLAPVTGDLLIGLAAARMAIGRGEEAAAELDAILKEVPSWVQGHMQLAQLRSMLGRPGAATASIERALTALPNEAALWRGLFDLHLRREDYEGLVEGVAKAKAAGQAGLCAEYEAIAAGELGETERADTLFESAPRIAHPTLALWRIRHLLRSGQVGKAVELIDRELQTDRAPATWPYAAIAWRLANDPRGQWLESDARLVVVTDISKELPALSRLAELVRSLHVAKGGYLDQSVRGGTQTDGPLLSRIEPEIRAVRAAIVRAVERYIAALPPQDLSHPLLQCRRDRRIRFAGSWSVRLRGAGHHSNHVHPLGWISSALYVALPQRGQQEDVHAGWLALGEPQAALGLDCAPTRMVEPREGQLVLFPSWMWHGTRPFADGERLTVAFDVAPPR